MSGTLFYEGIAADLAAEYLQEVHHIDAAKAPGLWMHYAAAAREMGFAGDMLVPVAGPVPSKSGR